MAVEDIKNLFDTPDHQYLALSTFANNFIERKNNEEITVTDGKDTDEMDYITITDVTNLNSPFNSGSVDPSILDNTSLSDHNYFNSVNDQMPAANVNLAMILNRSSGNTCSYCNKLFKNQSALQRHIRMHTKEKPFKCQVCNKSFSQQSNLWKHIRIHTGERPFECSQCKKCFTQRANMQKHMLIHSGLRPYECQYCLKSFTQLANLNKHVQLHNGIKPYSCKYCDRTFAQRSNMVKHQHLHEGVKPFSCPICLMPFTQQSNLKKHLTLHNNDRKHSCEKCGKRYVQKINLYKHRLQCKGELLTTLQNALGSEPNTHIKFIRIDGQQKHFLVNEQNEMIKVEVDIDESELYDTNSDKSCNSTV